MFVDKIQKFNAKMYHAMKDITLNLDLKRNHGMIKNLKRTSYDKNLLISYIIDPFVRKIDMPFHVNVEQIVIITDIFSELGYNIDIIDFNNEYKFELDNYDMVFGFGKNFDRAAKDFNVCTIAYLTGANPYWSNLAEMHRLKELIKRRGTTVRLRRQVECWDLYAGIKTDAAICKGNQWTQSTWQELYTRLYMINNYGLGRNVCNKVKRNLTEARKCFCFFSGSGNVHKGLDLVLECFSQLREFELYVVTPIDRDFSELYSTILKQENIHVLGKINVESKEYLDVCNQCLFSILASCSEGQASSIVTTMYCGMIPIITRECGIDIKEQVDGFLMQSIEPARLTRQIREIADLSEEILDKISKNVKEKARAFYSTEYFEMQFKEAVKKILSEII